MHDATLISNPAAASPGLAPTATVRTVCSPNCTGSCGITAHVREGRLVRVEPADFPDPRYRRICLKGIAMAMQRLDHPERIRQPLIRRGARGAGDWEEVSWEAALDHLATRLGDIAARFGAQANSWISMTGNYGINALMLSTRVANCLGGTAFTNFGIMGDLGANMGFLPALGVHQEAHEWSDVIGAKLIILFGKNIADTEHGDMHFLLEAAERGARIVVVDPRYSRTATKADQWISLRPGTDAALTLGMIHVIVGEGLLDEAYVVRHTNAPFLVRTDDGRLLRAGDLFGSADPSALVWDEASDGPCLPSAALRPALAKRCRIRLADGSELKCRTAFDLMREAWEPWTPEHAASVCEVPAQTIRALAREYAGTKPASLWVGQGAQRYYHGHLAFRGVITLAALTGNIGKPHSGANWAGGTLLRMILGTPQSWLEPGGRVGRSFPGTRLHEIIARGQPWPVKSLWVHNYGFGSQTPRREWFLREALPQLELFVVTEQMMTHAARHADVVLPAVSYYEDGGDVIGSWNNAYVQMRRRAIAPIGSARSDWEIFKGLCERMGCGEHWQMSVEQSSEFIVANSADPAIAAIDFGALRDHGVARAALADPHRPFADLKFPTPSGRIELYTEQLHKFGQVVLVFEEPLESNRRPQAGRHSLTLMTAHQMHTVHGQHTMLPWIRELLPGPRLHMHPRDALARGIADEDLVTVFNDRGRFQVRVTLTEGVKPGSLNLPQGWWPEDFASGHYNDVAHLTPNPVQDAILETSFAVFDNLVEVVRAEPAGSGHA